MIAGGIILWSGAVIDIPAGYQLCDGTNGTPDLRGQFVIGAGGAYAVAANGGAATHNHNLVLAGNGDVMDSAEAGPYTNWTDSQSNLPPYYALCYIQKM